MNAIVYGWTRDDFVHTIAINNRTEEMNSGIPNNFSDATELDESSRENNFDETLNANSDHDSD